MSTLASPIVILLEQLEKEMEFENAISNPLCSECGSIYDQDICRCTNTECPSNDEVYDLDDIGYLLDIDMEL